MLDNCKQIIKITIISDCRLFFYTLILYEIMKHMQIHNNKMKKNILILLFSACSFYSLQANSGRINPEEDKDFSVNDTLYTELRKDIVILSSTKETNSLRFLPAAVSVLSQKNLDALQVRSIKDLTAIVPNYYSSTYGSKMTAPLYIRGVGARSGVQTVSLYVDNVPYFNTASFDTELFDIQRLEVLRGTQGTLYGRNAMGGIINIYTYSPLSYQGTKVRMGGGNYGLFHAEGSNYSKLNDNMGVSALAYYKRSGGHFTNMETGNKVDRLKNYGFRTKYAWNINPNLNLNYMLSYDYVDQGAFPYEDLETGRIDHNIDGFYKRKLVTNGLTLKYKGDGYEINSVSGYQYLNDDMGMDIDYTTKKYFEINQKQNQNSLSQEFAIKSTKSSNYQWSGGIYGFYDYLNTNSPVYMLEDGVKEYIVPLPIMQLNRETLDLNSKFKSQSHGMAAFHQSTYNNLFVKGLSATVGLRLDYEKTQLRYNSYLADDAVMTINTGPNRPPMNIALDTTLVGKTSEHFLELLPRFVLKYEFDHDKFIYASASKGYKTGGHNMQGFADILQYAVMSRRGQYAPQDINKMITFKPEYSWNYELGGQFTFLDNLLQINYALFYMNIDDVQLTKFVATMGGRMVTNAGKAKSMGGELSLKVRPCSGFFLYANYGYADAEFRNHKFDDPDAKPNEDGEIPQIDYSGNRIPFAPRSTFSLGAVVDINLKNKNLFLDEIAIDNSFNALGSIYWNESNTMKQNFYGTWNAKIEFTKGPATLEFWGKNILDRRYKAFVFDSGKGDDIRYYGQKGLPAEFGAALRVSF